MKLNIKFYLVRFFNLVRFINYPMRTILVPDNFGARIFWSRINFLLHFLDIKKRKQLIKNYPSLTTIPIDKGFSFSKHSLTKEVNQLIKHLQNINWDEKSNSLKKPFLQSINYKYGDLDCLDKIISSPEIVGTVGSYLGVFPVFHRASILYSPNDEEFNGVSQDAHIDSEDILQVKCWIPLEEITDDSGPLNVLSSIRSREIYSQMKKDKLVSRRNEKISDIIINKYVDSKEWFKCVGKSDQVFFVDTCNCYHFGSRKAKKSRLVLMIHYCTPASMEMPFFVRRKDKRFYGDLAYLVGYQNQLFTNKHKP